MNIHKVSLGGFSAPCRGNQELFLIQSVSETGGHLAFNLGVVELDPALHNVL